MVHRRRGALAVAVAVVLSALALPSAAQAAVDTSFGTGGRTAVRLNGGWVNFAGDAVRMADDRIVVAGLERNYGLAVARFTAAGLPDASFDGDGIATAAASAGYPTIGGVATDAGGNVYVAFGDQAASGSVWKFTAAGARDGSFGIAGVKSLTGAYVQPGGLRLSPDGGRLLVSAASGNHIQVHALDPVTGAYDTSGFGTGGVADLDLGATALARDLVVRPGDGKIIVAGGRQESGLGTFATTMLVARFTAGGTVDTSFGGGTGRVTPFLGFSAQVSMGYDVYGLADGSTYVVGAGDDQASLAIAKVTDSGANDTSFGGGGLATDYQAGSAGNWDGVSVQPDGGVVVAGGRFAGGDHAALTRRYLASGVLDTSFGSGGTETLPHTYPAVALAAQSGRYVSMAFEPDALNAQKSILVLTGYTPNLQSTGGGGGGSPAAPVVPVTPPIPPVPAGCTRTLTIGPLQVGADCLTRDGLVWTTSGKATIGGLSFVPNGAGSKLIVDPLNLRVAVSGAAKVQLTATVYGRTLGPVTLYDGAFDWTFQYRPDLSGLAGLVMPQPGTGGKSVSLGTLGKLPGLSGVGSLPQLPYLKLPDFTRVSATDVAKFAGKVPSLRTPDVSFPLSLLDVGSLPPLRFEVPRAAGSIFGFPIQGDVTIAASERGGVKGADVTVNLGLPAFLGGITGSGKVWVGANGTADVDALGVNADEVNLPGQIRVAPVRLAYDGPSSTWAGDTKVFLGFQSQDTGLGGRWLVENGQLRRIGISVAGIPLGGLATIDSLDADLTLGPTRVFGTVAVGAGPKIPVLNTRAIGVDGTFDFNGEFAKLTGDLRVANVALASASAEYWWNGYFTAKGRVKYYLDADEQYGFEGNIDGEASAKGFNAEGSVTFRAGSHSAKGSGLVSSRGVAGCAKLAGFLWTDLQVGAGYLWGAKNIDWLGGSCDFAKYRAKVSAVGAQAGGAQSVVIAAKQKAYSLKVSGPGETPPQFTLTGPGGVTVQSPAGAGSVQNDRFFIVAQPGDHTTYVAIARPAKGRWTLTPAAGSAITSIQTSGTLPHPKVTARMRGGRLSYKVTPISGQVVRFVEQGKHVQGELGTAKGGKGALTVVPAAGPGGRRAIVAIVEQDGLVRARITVAHYVAPKRALGAPRVVVRRSRTGVASVAWTRVPGATGYRVLVKLNGRAQQRTLPAPARALKIRGVLASSGVIATVQALGGPTRIGKAGKGTVSTPKVKKRARKQGKG